MRILAKVLVLLVLVWVPVEVVSYVAGKLLAGSRLLYFQPHVEDYSSYLRDRDPLLGWPSPAAIGRNEYDSAGSRITPRFPDPGVRSCVALFGDSFTWGDEVAPEYAYGNVLSNLLGCRVANYGVGGYGTDQAYLRYSRVIRDDAEIVVLGHYSENIIRNINQARGFMGGQAFGLKPRFVVEDGELKLIPLPDLTEEQYKDLDTDAKELLPYEYFYPGGPSGTRALRFPYSWSVLRLLGHYRIRARLSGRPSYAEFYESDHPSGALDVTTKILVAFDSEARARGQRPLVVLIPDEKDLLWLREHGSLPYAALIDALKEEGIEVLSAAEGLNSDLGASDPCELYTRCGGAHFNPDGYSKLAGIVHAEIIRRGWLPQQVQ